MAEEGGFAAGRGFDDALMALDGLRPTPALYEELDRPKIEGNEGAEARDGGVDGGEGGIVVTGTGKSIGEA